MEVLVGPKFSIKAAALGTYVRDRPEEKISSSCLLLKEEDVGGNDSAPESDLDCLDVCSESSSSIGSPGDNNDEEAVISCGGKGGFASLGSLEDSLPIKRGLSNHYAGKPKSLAISSMKELQKAENPFNERRRL